MISILDIDHSHSVELADFLKPITSDVKITLVESELLKSDKIIISFSGSIQKAIRKIHLMNLFSALRMITDLPVLGIDSGMHLMCEKVDNFACLSMISGLMVNTEEINNFPMEENFSEIVTVCDDVLFYNMKEGSKFFFEKCNFMLRNEFTTSVLKNNKNFTSSVRKNNFYGVQFLPQKSGENGLNVLKNFVDI